MEWGENRAARPSPGPDQILAALRAVGGGPLAVGPLAFGVCRVMGVDTGGRGSYDLRTLISWSGYVKKLRLLTEDGAVVALPLRRWRGLSGGVLFAGDGRHQVQAYATAETAAVLRRAASAPPGESGRARQELALHLAQARVLTEHAGTVERYMREWLDTHPFPAARPAARPEANHV